MSSKITQSSLKQSLLEELRKRGTPQSFYIDLVNDYMAMWVIKQNLIKDVAERGVNVEYKNGKNQWGVKQNDSVNNLIKVNAQMLKVLQDLGLKGADQAEYSDDEL